MDRLILIYREEAKVTGRNYKDDQFML